QDPQPDHRPLQLIVTGRQGPTGAIDPAHQPGPVDLFQLTGIDVADGTAGAVVTQPVDRVFGVTDRDDDVLAVVRLDRPAHLVELRLVQATQVDQIERCRLLDWLRHRDPRINIWFPSPAPAL